MKEKLDILAFGAHPDDIELACSGTIIKHLKNGLKIGIIDLTRGELGTRGTVETRNQETINSTKVLGVQLRENMDFKDGFFENNEENKIELIKKIREYRPEIVLTNAPTDRHPDHGRSSELTIDACFLSGLEKIETGQDVWRPKHIYHYIQFNTILPDFVVDITEEMDKKLESVLCYKTQFYNPESKESETIISSEDFLESVKYRARDLGRQSDCKYAEGFVSNQTLKVNSLKDLI
jgi:N-acetylglucosamine malate deacetylase 1